MRMVGEKKRGVLRNNHKGQEEGEKTDAGARESGRGCEAGRCG